MILKINFIKPLDYQVNLIYSDYYINLYNNYNYFLYLFINKYKIQQYTVKYILKYIKINNYYYKRYINYQNISYVYKYNQIIFKNNNFLKTNLILEYLNSYLKTHKNISYIIKLQNIYTNIVFKFNQIFNVKTYLNEYIKLNNYSKNFVKQEKFNISYIYSYIEYKFNLFKTLKLVYVYIKDLSNLNKKKQPVLESFYLNIFNVNNLIIKKIIKLYSNINISSNIILSNYINENINKHYTKILTYKPLDYQVNLIYSDYYINLYKYKPVIYSKYTTKLNSIYTYKIKIVLNQINGYIKFTKYRKNYQIINYLKKYIQITNYFTPINFYKFYYWNNYLSSYFLGKKIGISKETFKCVKYNQIYVKYNHLKLNTLLNKIALISNKIIITYIPTNIKNIFDTLYKKINYSINQINTLIHRYILNKPYDEKVGTVLKFSDLIKNIYNKNYIIFQFNLYNISKFILTKIQKFNIHFNIVDYTNVKKYITYQNRIYISSNIYVSKFYNYYLYLNIINIKKLNLYVSDNSVVKYINYKINTNYLYIYKHITNKIFSRYKFTNNSVYRFIIRKNNIFYKKIDIDYKIDIKKYINSKYQLLYKNIKNISSSVFSAFNRISNIITLPIKYYQLFKKRNILFSNLYYVKLSLIEYQYYITLYKKKTNNFDFTKYSLLEINNYYQLSDIIAKKINNITNTFDFSNYIYIEYNYISNTYIYNKIFNLNSIQLNSVNSYIQNISLETTFVIKNLFKKTYNIYNNIINFLNNEAYKISSITYIDRYNTVKSDGIYRIYLIFSDYYINIYSDKTTKFLFENYINRLINKFKIYNYINEVVRLKRSGYINHIFNSYLFFNLVQLTGYKQYLNKRYYPIVYEKIVKNKNSDFYKNYLNVYLKSVKISIKNFKIDYLYYLRKNNRVFTSISKLVNTYKNIIKNYNFNLKKYRYLFFTKYCRLYDFVDVNMNITKNKINRNITNTVNNLINVEYIEGNYDYGLLMYKIYE